jgi:PAS domain S-box-containing protein
VVFSNFAALRLLGYPDAWALIGRGLDAFVHPDALEAARARQQVVTATSQSFPAMPLKLLTAEGETLQHSADVFPIEVAGNSLSVLEFGISLLPTPAPKPPPAPQIGAAGRRLGRALVEASSTPTLIQSLDTILYVNRVARERLGVGERSEIEGHSVMSIVHPDGLFSAAQRIAFVFGAHQPVYEVPTKLRCPDGRSVHIVADAYPVNADGRWAAFIMARSVRESELRSS